MVGTCPKNNKAGPSQTELSATHLESSSQEFVLDFQEVCLSLFCLEWFVDYLESDVVLNILPTAITMTGTS
jgi:hypothetical protein